MGGSESSEREVTLRGDMMAAFGRLCVWASPRAARARARELDIVSSSEGSRVWRYPIWVPIVFFAMLATFLAILLVPGPTWTREDYLWATLFVPCFVVVGSALIWTTWMRPRVIATADEVIIVQRLRTVRFPLSELDTAESGFRGISFTLRPVPGDGRLWPVSYDGGVLQTSNVTRWLGRVSPADRVAAALTREAAMLRGEDPPAPDDMKRRRGPGDLWMAFWLAVTGATRS